MVVPLNTFIKNAQAGATIQVEMIMLANLARIEARLLRKIFISAPNVSILNQEFNAERHRKIKG